MVYPYGTADSETCACSTEDSGFPSSVEGGPTGVEVLELASFEPEVPMTDYQLYIGLCV